MPLGRGSAIGSVRNSSPFSEKDQAVEGDSLSFGERVRVRGNSAPNYMDRAEVGGYASLPYHP
jgi:hypothetical protein